MRKKRRMLLGVLITGLISAVLVYNYVFNSAHRDISNEEATVSLSAKAIFEQFQTNEALATTNYLDQVIEMKGDVTSIEDNDVVLSSAVQVSFNSQETLKFQKGEQITIKGRCVGYDELLELVKIDQSTLIK
ncbi:OB-fold protein [Winogradskyella haliclonae]|uniref:tRNA_anti-like n=1 Tax=Winogradskyella haliclonae TaxID=2048558 RepID=A0ABQ2BXA8_9FLAO|nr:hypothetical protein [Winogradskyella haliclonae]GGI56422.1 hypothetical protein GCM10011444_07310 [Winogradskyella haliclonae]